MIYGYVMIYSLLLCSFYNAYIHCLKKGHFFCCRLYVEESPFLNFISLSSSGHVCCIAEMISVVLNF